MPSSNIPDKVNFDLLYQTIPGTYNTYDRKTIHDDKQLTFPLKIGANNAVEELRYKNFLKFPPRARGVMIEDIDIDITATQIDEVSKTMYNKVNTMKFPIKKFKADGTVDISAGIENLSFIDIINDSNIARRVAKLRALKAVVLGDPNLNQHKQILQEMNNQTAMLALIRSGLQDVWEEYEIGEEKSSYEQVMRSTELQRMLMEKFGDDYNEIMTHWSENTQILIDVSKSREDILAQFEHDDEKEEEEKEEPFEFNPEHITPDIEDILAEEQEEKKEPQGPKQDFPEVPLLAEGAVINTMINGNGPNIGLPNSPKFVGIEYYKSTTKGKGVLIEYVFKYGKNGGTNPKGLFSWAGINSSPVLQKYINDSTHYVEIKAADDVRLEKF